MKRKVSLLFIFVLGVFSIVFLSCKNEVSTGSNGTGGSGSGSGSGGEPKNKICSVLFCDDNGNQIFTQDVEMGKTVARPQNPEQKNGNDFDNWYTDLSFSTSYDFSLPVTSNLVLFGKWQNTVKFTVSFHSKYYDKNGIVLYQTENIRPSQQVQMGKYLSVPSLPASQYDGFCFDDWYTESGELFDFATAITSDTVLFAHFIDDKVLRVNYAPCSTTEMGTISQQNLTDIPLETTVRFYLNQNRIDVGTTSVTVTPNPKHIIEGFYQDKECTQEYGDTFVSTPGMKIFVKFMRDADMNYLCFTALENSSVKISTDNLEYSLGETWEWLPYNKSSIIDLLPGDRVYFRDAGNDVRFGGKFSLNGGHISASGNVLSLRSRTCKSDRSSFPCLFGYCTNLISAPELPATTLESECYYGMFRGCTSLQRAPELPAAILTYCCYQDMFYGCTSLQEAPKLPATTLASCCYGNMFTGCTSLQEAPELPATTLAYYCYQFMFSDCTSLQKAPELPVTTLTYCCYQGMFGRCTSLQEAPDLPVTMLVPECYSGMFDGCTSLQEAPDLPATTLASKCYKGMFEGCTSLQEAPELPATILEYYCYGDMFNGCTSLQKAPELPATTLVDGCYTRMFNGCGLLRYVKVAFLNWLYGEWEWATDAWLKDVGASGTFLCPSSLDCYTRDDNHVPSSWTIVRY